MTWLRAALIRMAKTGAQAMIAMLGSTALLTEVNWVVTLAGTGMAMLLSLLTSVAGLPEATSQPQPLKLAEE